MKSSLLLYAVTDRYWLNGRKLKDDVELAILGGATMIQLREKNLPIDEFIEEAKEIKEVCYFYVLMTEFTELVIKLNYGFEKKI